MVGTVRPTRKNFPKELASTNLEKGEAAFYYESTRKVMAVKYRAVKDKAQKKPKVVHALTTVHPNTVENSKKTDKDGNIIKKAKLYFALQPLNGWSRSVRSTARLSACT